MNKSKLKTIGLAFGLCFAVVGAGVAVSASSFQGAAVEAKAAEETTTYTFTSKGWEDSTSSWTSNKDGASLQNGRGVQITATATGAKATSVSAFENVKKVVFTYSTNASKGAGSIALKIGAADSQSLSVTTAGGTTDRTLEFDLESALSGNISFTVTCTTNSIYVKSVAITVDAGSDAVATGITTFGDEDGWFTIDGKNTATTQTGELLYEVEYDGAAGEGEITTSVTLSESETDKLIVSDDGKGTLTLTAKENNNYKLVLTAKDKDAQGGTVTKEIWVKVINLVEPSLPAKISDVGSLSIGDKIYFVNEDGGKVAGPLGSNTYLSSVACTFGDGNKITDYDGAAEFVLGRFGDAYTFAYNGELLGATSTKKLAIGNDSAVNTWNLSISSGAAGSVASVTSTNASYGTMKYNSSDPRFTTYVSGQNDIYLYAIHATPAEVAAEFEANYLFMDKEVADQCKTYYANAKSTFQTLSDEQIAEISQGALDRLAAWAKANGETFDPTEHTFKAAVNNAMPSAKTSTVVVLATVFGVTAALAGSLLFFRKRKEN